MRSLVHAPAASVASARETLSLDGEWDFAFDGPTARLDGPATIRSPGIWQTQFPALRNAQGIGRYRRRIELPPSYAGKRVVFVAEGIFHVATILVDGRPVATNANGWTDIEADLTDALGGRRAFTLGIDAEVPDDRRPERGGFSFALAGKQDWYGVHGGVWKPCRIEARDPTHLKDVAVSTATDLREHTLTVRGSAADGAAALLRITVSRAGEIAAQRDVAIGAAPIDITLDVPGAALWSPDSPALYDVSLALARDGAVVDRIDRSVGFRRFETRGARLHLNGEPFHMRAALDQDWYPQEDCRHPSDAFLEERFRNAKALGLNALRCHVKIPDRLYYELADRLGLMIWQDMPYPEFLAPSTRADLLDVFHRTVAAHGHHPSICIWTIANEGWGVDLDDNPDDRRWLVEQFDALKKIVPTSLVVDNSPCFPRNYHVKTDIEDFHWYTGFPQHNDQFAKLTSEVAARASFMWSPHGDAVRKGDEPLLCSEFGVWGLPHPRDIVEPDGSEPWWFESGHDWNQGAGYPHGIETRFRDAQLGPIFGGLDGFVDAAQEFQYRALKYQIETLRWARPLSGYVLTELNDVQWEANGLMDARNNKRRFADRLADLQRDHLVIARAARTAVRPGEAFTVEVRLAGAGEASEGATLEWRFGGRNGVAALSAAPSTLALIAPSSDRISIVDLELAARGPGTEVISHNRLEFCVTPAIADGPPLFPLDAGAEAALKAMDWPSVAPSAEGADVCVATRLTTPVRERVLAGRKVLVIANTDDALIDPARKLPLADRHNFPTMDLKAREGTPWDGRWMGAFTWRRTDGPWAALPNGSMFDEHWKGLIPAHVLTGFLAPAWGGLIDSGMAVGWLHKAAAFSKRSFLGKGWMTVATFDLTSEEAAATPLAPHVLAALARS